MKKFFAKRSMSIDNKQYQAGDIVYYNNLIDGLIEADELYFEDTDKKKDIKKTPSNLNIVYKSPCDISVIITFSNQLKFVNDCLSGFFRQDFAGSYEIIAVVDGSSENEVEYINKNFPLVKILKTDFKNACLARNAGAEIANGKFLAFFDGDDFPYYNYLKKMFTPFEDKSIDFTYSRFDHILFPLSKGKLPRCNIFEWSESWGKYSPINNTPILIKKDLSPRWPIDLPIMQDAGFGLKLIAKGLKGFHIREHLWNYTNSPQGTWNNYGVAEKKKKAMKELKNKYGIKTRRAELTFISLISRDEVLSEYFGQIKNLGMPKATHWFVLMDTNDENLIKKVNGFIDENKHLFWSVRVFVSNQNNLKDERDFDKRGLRIANWISIIINQAGENFGGTDFLFMVEDDTLAPKNTYLKLKKIIDQDNKIAMASGIECGRGFTRHTGACNLIKDDKGEIIGRDIPKMQDGGVVNVEGCGWYCWVGRVAHLKDFLKEKKFKSIDGKMLGVDVLMWASVREMGFDCLVDFSVQCQHYNGKIKRWLPASEGKGYDINYYKDQSGSWKMNLKEKL